MIGDKKWNTEQFKLHPTPYTGLAGIFEKNRIKKIISFINDLNNNPKTIIEVGCEAGGLLKEIEIKYPNTSIIGIDISPDASKDAMLKVDKAKIFVHDIVKEPFNKRYDVIICSEVLEHIPSPNDEKAIENISKMSDKNCIIIFSVPYEKIKNEIKKILKAIGLMKILFPGIEESKSEWHVQDYSRKEICDKLGKYFEIIHYENNLLHQFIVCRRKK